MRGKKKKIADVPAVEAKINTVKVINQSAIHRRTGIHGTKGLAKPWRTRRRPETRTASPLHLIRRKMELKIIAAPLHLVRPKKELKGEPVEKAQEGEKCRWLHVWNGNLILLDRMQS
jgi:hypothetical protein